LFNLYKEGWR